MNLDRAILRYFKHLALKQLQKSEEEYLIYGEDLVNSCRQILKATEEDAAELVIPLFTETFKC